MDMSGILNVIGRMFPSVNLNEAVQKAQQAINGTPDSLEGVSSAAKGLGLNAQAVDTIYNKYGNTMQARMVCKVLGTTPEALRADAEKIVGGQGSLPTLSVNSPAPASTKFPRLK